MIASAPEHADGMYRLALKVRSRRELERFLGRLAEDFDINRQVWENRSLPDYLTALADCSRRAEGIAKPDNFPGSGPESWQFLARLFLAASVVRRRSEASVIRASVIPRQGYGAAESAGPVHGIGAKPGKAAKRASQPRKAG